MDFGFAPGTGYLASVRGMFARRGSTTVIAPPGASTIRQFVTRLDTSTAIAKPVNDLLVGSHANDEGHLLIAAFPGQQGTTQFETLETSLNDPTKSIAIDDSVIGYKENDPVTHTLHIKGCNIGKARPFLLKLQEALGKHVRITAPNHFHGLAQVYAQGIFEFLAYEFVVRRPEHFPDKPTAIAEFDGGNFTLINGDSVPTADWRHVIPTNPNTPTTQSYPLHLFQRVGSRTTLTVQRQYRVVPVTFSVTVSYPKPSDVPPDEPTRRSQMREIMVMDPRFQDAHPYPIWTRVGFTDLDDFIAGHKWVFTKQGKTLHCTGTRFVYTLLVPITDPATKPANGFFAQGDLIFNFYPNVGSPLSAIPNKLPVTEPVFFSTI